MKRWMMIPGALAAAISTTACAPVVIDPVQGTGGSGGSGSSASGSSGGGTNALAILAKDLPGGSLPFSPGAPVDPDALVLIFSNLAQACSTAAEMPTTSCGLAWQGILMIPPDLVRVGLVDLSSPRIVGLGFSYEGSCMNGGSAAVGGGGPGGGPLGPMAGGMLQIVSTDSGSITVDLLTPLEVPGPSPDPMLSGQFTAMRCEPAPPAPPPNAAVAIRGSSLPPGLPANPTIGASPDPTALYVFLGTGTQTCTDPLPSLGCSGAGRMVLKIPQALQTPGTLMLSDPQLAASAEISPATGPGNCTDAVASTFTQGTLEIQSADASGLSFTLFQSVTGGSTIGLFDADGLYQATLCP